MRISTASFYTASLPAIQGQQSAIARLNQQIASGQNYLAPKDNPVATSRIIQLTDNIALRNQYVANIQKADLVLSQEDTILGEMNKALTQVQGLLQSVSTSHDQGIRDQMAQQIGNIYLHIKDLANSRDPSGNYLFAGFQTDTRPFEHIQDYNNPLGGASDPTLYAGDAGVRRIEIESGRQVQASDTLTDVFQIGDPLDLLQALDQAAIDLADPALAQPALAASLQGSIDVVNNALGRLTVKQNEVVGRMVELDDVQKTLQSLKLCDQKAIDEIQELDQAAAIVELQQRQTTLQASMEAFAKVSGLSLFEYL